MTAVLSNESTGADKPMLKGLCPPYIKRRVRCYTVTLFGLVYYSDALKADEDVFIVYDEQDTSKILVHKIDCVSGEECLGSGPIKWLACLSPF